MKWLKPWCLAILMMACSAAQASIPGFTDEEAIDILRGAETSPARIYALAKAIDDTEADEYYCYMKYLYSRVAQAPAPEHEEIVAQAKSRLNELKEDGLRCTVSINPAPNVPLDQVLIVGIEETSAAPTPTEAPTNSPSDKELASATAPKDSLPSGRPVRTEPQQPAPDKWSKRERTSPASSAQFDPRPINEVAQSARTPVVVSSSSQECVANVNLLHWRFNEAGVAAELSRLVYTNADSLKNAEDAFTERLNELREAARIPGKNLAGLELKLKEAQDALQQEQELQAAKPRYLGRMGVRTVPHLLSDLATFAGKQLGDVHETGFYAEAHELPGGVLAVVYRGTVSMGGMLSNAKNFALGTKVGKVVYGQNATADSIPQYELANQLIRMLLARGYKREHIIATGHSLGGGLATYSHLRHNLGWAYTFNAAELGRVLAKEVFEVGYSGTAHARQLNFVSIAPDLSKDVVSQLGRVQKILTNLGYPTQQLGFHYGKTYAIPIHIPEMDKSARKLSSGVVTGGVGYVGLRVAKGLMPGKALTFKNPIRKAVFAGAAYVGAKKTENLVWRTLSLHFMDNLADAMTHWGGAPNLPLTCASPLTQ